MDMPSPHDHINNNTLFTALQQASGLAPASEQSSTASQHNTMSAQSNLDGSHQPHPSATSSTLAGAESTQPATSPTSPLSSSTPSGSNATTSAGSLPCQASTCPTQISAAHSHQASTCGSSFNKTDHIAYFNWKRTKIHWLTEQYNNIKKTILQQTSAGVLLQDMDHNSSVAEYLKASENLSEAEVLETTSGMEAYQQATEDARIQQRENQQQYEQEQAAAMEGMSQNQVQKFRQEKALDLREEMLTALFASHGCPFEDTTAESQRMGMTTLAFTEWQERQN
ncbi:hypothetical protein NDA14_001194 [Ustilago hordei]|nr:hypothetical protein NDA14_001194 [Ustilago hordei]